MKLLIKALIRDIVILTILGCRGTGMVTPSKIDLKLEPIDEWHSTEEITDICADGKKILLLSSSGTRILALDWQNRRVDTIPLNTRVIPPRGIASDRYYIYVYNDKTLYRLAKDNWTMVAWLNNIRVTGLANYAPGEMLVSDKEREVIWRKTLFRESRTFLDRGDNITRPGAMALFPDGVFGVLVAPDFLVKVNRAGIVFNRCKVPQGIEMLVTDKNGQAFLMQRGKSVIWILRDNTINGYELPRTLNPIGIAIIEDQIAVLDSGTKIIFYSIPGR